MKTNQLFFRSLLIAPLLFSNIGNSFGLTHKPGRAIVVSEEINRVTGSIPVKIKFYFNDTVKVVNAPKYKSPKSWIMSFDNDITFKTFYPGDTIILKCRINFPRKNLPFFPQKIEVSHELIFKGQPAEKHEVTAIGMIYFTPYNTIEIWDEGDFYNLNRQWLDKASKIDTQRIFIPKSEIPLSNLMDADQIIFEWQEDRTVKKVKGLAYMIPMKPMSPDSIDWYSINVGDGPDSVNNSRATYRGNVSGRLVTTITNDIGDPVTIPLRGIRVKLVEEDCALGICVFENFAAGYTDENGNFDLSYNKLQSFEGNRIELYLQFKSKTKDDGDYKIKCKENNVWQNIYEQKIFLGNFPKSNQNLPQGDVERNHDAFRVVHWARNAMIYVRPHLDNLSKVAIKIFKDGSQFLADGFLGISAPITDPTIYLTNGDGDHENTVYHEFGHYFLWEIQNKNYIMAYTDPNQSGHSWARENTSRVAWHEGWADAMQMILDAEYRNEDNEYGFDESSDEYENRTDWGTNSINNGLWSEYYFACAIYDLWDGPGKGLAGTIPGTNIHAFRDNNTSGWLTEDNIELTFEQIITPIVNHKGSSNKITHVNEYFRYLLDEVAGTNCQLRQDIARCFTENRVVWIISNYESHSGNTSMAAGDLYWDITEDIEGELAGVNHTYTDNYLINLYARNRNDIIDFFFYIPEQKIIIDDLWLGSEGAGAMRGELSINPSIAYYNTQGGTLSTCEGTNLDITNGSIILGGSGATADLEISNISYLLIQPNGSIEINDGSQLTIKSGGSLIVQSGATVILNGSGRIEVQANAFVCIHPNAQITLQDNNSELFIHQNSIIGVNPLTGINAICSEPCDLTFSGSGNLNATAGITSINIGPDLTVNYGESITLYGPTGASSYTWSKSTDGGNGWIWVSSNQNINISKITDNTIYYLTVYYPSGCNGTDEIKITVNCPPVTLTPVSKSICKGCKITLTATTLLSDAIYTWCERKNNQPEVCMGKIGNPNFATFEPKTITTYRVEVTSPSLGCTVSSQEVTITINPDCACYNPHPPHSELACGGSGNDNDNLIGSPNGHVFHQSAQLANTEKVFEGEIHVAKNATLRIENSTIYMRECSRIIVEGRMEVINSQLKGCENARWKGVEVRGNKNLEQIPGNQGTMLIEGSIIADAEIGILLGQRNGQTFDMNSGGGILEMRAGNVMERNKIHIKALPFEKPNYSIIEFTEFRELFKGGASQCVLTALPRHIQIEKINGIKIHNNTFMGEDLGIHLQESKNFSIKGNYFNETKVAIKTENSPLSDMGFDISNNHFIKSQNALEFNNDNHTMLKVYCNEFFDYADHGVLSTNTQLADQGTLQKGAGNSYTSASTQTNHSWAHQGNTMNYFHDPSNPINLTTGNGYTANAVAAQQDNTCGALAKTSNTNSTIINNEESENDELDLTGDFGQYQLNIFPNPFNHQTNIIYTLIQSQEVTLYITNIHGQVIDKLIDGKKQEAGCYKLTYDAIHLAPGIYYYTLQAGGVYIETKKMGVLR